MCHAQGLLRRERDDARDRVVRNREGDRHRHIGLIDEDERLPRDRDGQKQPVERDLDRLPGLERRVRPDVGRGDMHGEAAGILHVHGGAHVARGGKSGGQNRRNRDDQLSE